MTIRNEELENPRNQKGFEKAQRHIIKSAGHVSKKKKSNTKQRRGGKLKYNRGKKNIEDKEGSENLQRVLRM